MIIVSQDKCTIVNLDNVKTIELDRETDFKSIIIFRETNEVETGVCGLFIGHYATRERAKEVLQEIVMLFKEEEMFHIRKSSLNNLDELAEPKYILKPVYRPKVYEMPED